jgi:hypothetical protein
MGIVDIIVVGGGTYKQADILTQGHDYTTSLYFLTQYDKQNNNKIAYKYFHYVKFTFRFYRCYVNSILYQAASLL